MRTAAVIDVNASIADRLAVLIGGVVVVSMLLLLVAFRSVVIAATAAVMNLLSVAAAYGVCVPLPRRRLGRQADRHRHPHPMAAFVPVIMFALLFGLSMDYEVFLISRIREAWVRTRDNGQAITAGLASTGRVITAAAAIMIVVFAALIPSDEVFIKVFGVGMVAAILVDATIIRMLLVPAVMHLLGRSNWWLPRRHRPTPAPAAHRGAGRDRRPRALVRTSLKESVVRKVFAGLAIALALAVVSQFYLAASGAFDTTPKDESFQTHRTLGYVIVLFALLLTGIAALARMPRRLIGMTGLVAGLGVAQALIRLLADSVDNSAGTGTSAGSLVFGLHAINGLIMLALAATVAWRGFALARRVDVTAGG